MDLFSQIVETQNLVDEAISFGFVPVPLIGKRPKVSNWTARTLQEAQSGFSPGDNVGVLTGPPSNILVVDVDLQQRGLEVWNSWISAHGDPQTPCVRTGSGGLHYYFKYQDGFRSTSKVVKIGDEVVGIDIKTDGGQVVYPGSIHPDTKKRYEWIRSPSEFSPQPVPLWLVHKLQTEKPGDQIKTKSKLVGIKDLELTQGQIAYIWGVFQTKLPELSDVYQLESVTGTLLILKRVKKALCPVCQREHDHENAYLAVQTKKFKVKFYCRRDESRPILLIVMKPDGGGTYQKLMQAHRGHAEIVIDQYGENMEVVHPEGPIYLYDEKSRLWKEITTGQFSVCIPTILDPIYEKEIDERRKTIELYQKMGKSHENAIEVLNRQIKELYSVKSKINTIGFNKSVTEWVTNVLSQKYSGMMFDGLPKMLPIRDKLVLNLQTGETRSREKEDRFTYEIPIFYRPGKKNEFLDKFMAEIMLEDLLPVEQRVKVQFLQRLLGYAFTGECREQIMAVFSGEGLNGKSTLSDLLRRCMSAIVKSANKSIIMKRNNASSANSELHMLRGCRIALVSETQDNELIDEDTFKRMTGGDEVQSRNLFTNFVSWTPRFVPFMFTNHVPKCSGDKATLRRILIFKFMAKFVENPRLPHERKINRDIKSMWADKDVKEAFLTWIVEGAMDYYRQGLNPPQEIIENTEQYRKNMNSFEVFLEEDVHPESTAEDRTSFNELWNRYQQRCKDEALVPMTKTAFGLKLKWTRVGSIYYHGSLLEQQTYL
jgi:P4 family phage/plasmid primase-like protien